LKFVDGPLKMTETCRHFAKTLDTQFLVQSSSGIGKVLLRKALLANNKEIETILRDDLRVEDDVLNCGHCDHTDRAIVRRCNAPPRHRGEDDDRSDEYYEQTRYECKRMMYICKECTISSDVYCAICDTYGTYNTTNIAKPNPGIIILLHRSYPHRKKKNILAFTPHFLISVRLLSR
jgi:hypothetical protein